MTATTTDHYCILIPSTKSETGPHQLWSTDRFAMWVTLRKNHATPVFGTALVDQPHSAQTLQTVHPQPLSQRLVAQANRLKQDEALKRPDCLSAESLGAMGYDFAKSETDPANIRALEKAIMRDPSEYRKFVDRRQANALALVGLVYPDFPVWFDQANQDSPLTAEFLLEFASVQVEAFLEGSPGLLPIVPSTASTGDPTLTLEAILSAS